MGKKSINWKFLSPAMEKEILSEYEKGTVRRTITQQFRITEAQLIFIVRESAKKQMMDSVQQQPAQKKFTYGF